MATEKEKRDRQTEEKDCVCVYVEKQQKAANIDRDMTPDHGQQLLLEGDICINTALIFDNTPIKFKKHQL